MTSNAARAEILVRALQARIESDEPAIAELYTDDVQAWAPGHATSSVEELGSELARRTDDAFSDIALDVVPLDVGGDYACAEWSVSMTHTGPLVLGETTIEPTGLRVTVHGATVAEFRDERICALRQYWDEFSVLEQLGVVARED